jgi:F-type H+-transporting ATPase subunit epsilon
MSLDLEILVADGVVLRKCVTGLQATDASGRFGLLPHHQAFLTLLAPCLLTFRDENGREGYAAADGGVLLLEDDHVAVVTREAVVADRLEAVAPAVAAMLEARRLQEQTARAEFVELQTSLLRELGKVERRP